MPQSTIFYLLWHFLRPSKRALARSSITLLASSVISLVVALVIVYTSVTSGIERRWIHQLSTYWAPLRIVPSSTYESSYFNQMSQFSLSTGYSPHSLDQQIQYQSSFMGGSLKEDDTKAWEDSWDAKIDPPLDAKMQAKQDAAKMARHPLIALSKLLSQKTSSQNSTLSPAKSEVFQTLCQWKCGFQKPFKEAQIPKRGLLEGDELHELYTSIYTVQSQGFLLGYEPLPNAISEQILPLTQKELQRIWSKLVRSGHHANLQKALLEQLSAKRAVSKKSLLKARMCSQDLVTPQDDLLFYTVQGLNYFLSEKKDLFSSDQNCNSSIIICPRKGYDPDLLPSTQLAQDLDELGLSMQPSPIIDFTQETPVYLYIPQDYPIYIDTNSLDTDLRRPSINIDFFDSKKFRFNIHADDINPIELEYTNTPKDFYKKLNAHAGGIWLPERWQSEGIQVADSIQVLYQQSGFQDEEASSEKFLVLGFFQTGIEAWASRAIIATAPSARDIYLSQPNFDQMMSNHWGFWVNPEKRNMYKEDLQRKLKANELDTWFTIESLEDYEFCKDLIFQLKSDRIILMIVSFLILLVACSSIISMLIILVHERRDTIAIFLALGVSRRSIIRLFAYLGAAIGATGGILGMSLGAYILHYLPQIGHFFSKILGYSLFNPQFFGQTIPNTLDNTTTLYIAIFTLTLSTLSGLVSASYATSFQAQKLLQEG